MNKFIIKYNNGENDYYNEQSNEYLIHSEESNEVNSDREEGNIDRSIITRSNCVYSKVIPFNPNHFDQRFIGVTSDTSNDFIRLKSTED